MTDYPDQERAAREPDEMAARAEQRIRRIIMSADPGRRPCAAVSVGLSPRPAEVAVAFVPAGAGVLVRRDGYGTAGEYPADKFPMSTDADLWVTVPGDRVLLGWGAQICAYYSPAGISRGKHKRDRDIWLQAAALVERGGTAYVCLERQSPYGQPAWVAVSVRTESEADSDAS